MIPSQLATLGLPRPMNLSQGPTSGPRCVDISRTMSLAVTHASITKALITSPMDCSAHSPSQISHGHRFLSILSPSSHHQKDFQPSAFLLINSPRWLTLLQLLTMLMLKAQWPCSSNISSLFMDSLMMWSLIEVSPLLPSSHRKSLRHSRSSRTSQQPIDQRLMDRQNEPMPSLNSISGAMLTTSSPIGAPFCPWPNLHTTTLLSPLPRSLLSLPTWATTHGSQSQSHELPRPTNLLLSGSKSSRTSMLTSSSISR